MNRTSSVGRRSGVVEKSLKQTEAPRGFNYRQVSRRFFGGERRDSMKRARIRWLAEGPKKITVIRLSIALAQSLLWMSPSKEQLICCSVNSKLSVSVLEKKRLVASSGG